MSRLIWQSTLRIGLVVLFLACAALWAASAAANYQFGLQQCGQSEGWQIVCGTASIAADAIKAGVIFGAIVAWRTRHWGAMAACVVLATVTISYSVISSASFYTWMTADTRAERTLQSATTDNRVAEMRSLEKSLADARHAAIHDQYRKDREAAKALATDLQARIDWLRAEIKVSHASGGADPTAALLSQQAGLSEDFVYLVRLVAFMALLELGSSLSLTAFSQLFTHGISPPSRPPPGTSMSFSEPAVSRPPLTVVHSTPEVREELRRAQIDAFLDHLIDQGLGGQYVPADEFRAHYRQWCRQHRQETLSASVLGRQLSLAGVHTRRSGKERTYLVPAQIVGHLHVVKA